VYSVRKLMEGAPRERKSIPSPSILVGHIYIHANTVMGLFRVDHIGNWSGVS
jgi:hypothetical protein